MKKIICFIIAATLLLATIPFAASAANGTVTVNVAASATAVCPGESVIVTVSVAGNPGFSGYSLNVVIPAGFTIESITPGNLAIPSTFTANPANGFVSNWSATGLITGDGVLFTAKLVAGAAVSPVATFGVTNPVFADIDTNNIPVVAPTAPQVSTPGHVDANLDHVCDNGCGTAMGVCADSDTDNDHVCDYGCGKVFSPCYDNTNDHICDLCGKPGVTPHIDSDFNHYCDICNDYAGMHVINSNSHKCWICGLLISVCADYNNDHLCDVCGVVLSACSDNFPVDGNCDLCGKKLADCKDEDKDHKCDTCGSVLTKCADENKDHKCDICGETVSECVDEDKDEKCDICEKQLEHVHNLEHTPAKAATCFEEGNLEYWYCAGCNCFFTDAEGKYNIAYLSLMTPVAHKIEHVEAKDPTETEEGNIEYWYCTECGYAWLDELCTKNTNLKAVILPATGHIHNLEYTAAKAATCFEEGNLEYWYCAGCNCFFTDAEGKYNIAYLSLMTPVAHKIEHVAAVAPTATENGNIEYWFCTECGYAWLDEFCTKNTNLKAVILPATGEIIDNPPTGDTTVFVMVALVAVATISLAVLNFKKRED